ncbi:MAG: hypothetical protein LCH79_08015 [Proteobacteria bacterium]|nr:hypothetical protein [Pseudomonadota bacterium]
MSTIQVAQISMGYSPALPDGGLCPGCVHVKFEDGLRCTKGGFWVRRAAGCNEFQPKPAEPPKVQIGPTDI